MIGAIQLCRVFLLNYLYIANIFHDFFSKFSHLFFDWFRANRFFGKSWLGILSLSNVKIYPLSTDSVIYNSADLAWLSFSVFETFSILRMVMWFSINSFRNFRFSSSSDETFRVNSIILFLPLSLELKCSFLFFFICIKLHSQNTDFV